MHSKCSKLKGNFRVPRKKVSPEVMMCHRLCPSSPCLLPFLRISYTVSANSCNNSATMITIPARMSTLESSAWEVAFKIAICDRHLMSTSLQLITHCPGGRTSATSAIFDNEEGAFFLRGQEAYYKACCFLSREYLR